MSTNQSGMNSTPAPTAGAANQPVSPATPTVGNTAGMPANATVPPGFTLASLDEAELLELKYDAPILDAQVVDTGQTQLTQLERPHRGTLRALLGYAYLRQNVHRDPITPINCMNIDVQAFFNYQCSGDFIVFNNSSFPQPFVSKPDHRKPIDSSPDTLLPTQMETNPDSHLATVRNKFAPKHGELQRPMSEESDRQATVDVISNQYSDTTSLTTIVSSALQPSIRTSDGVNILNGSRATQLVGAQSTMSRPTQNKSDIANDVIFNSNLEWDQTLLDPNIDRLDEQGKDETDEYPMDLENGEQQCVMSDKLAVVPATKRPPPTPQQEAKQHEFMFYGVKYRSFNNHNVIYSIQKANTRKHLALIDKGANGGIAGDDARIIIAIIRQQAYIGKGQSILSSGQMEHFKIVVDDKSTKVGGQQRLTTQDGSVLPLDIRSGLPYLRMHPPTDRELSNPNIPHVVLTSDTDWDPSVLDHSIDNMKEWAKSVPDHDPDDGEHLFDLVGVLKNNEAVTSFKDSKLDETIDFFENFNSPEDSPIPECFEVYEARKPPSILFSPGQSVNYDIESAPLKDSSFKDLILDSDKPTSRTPHGEMDHCAPPRSTLDDAVAFFTDFVLEDDLLQQLPEASMGRDDATSALPPVHEGNKSDREPEQTIDEIATNESILVCTLGILEATLDCTLDFLGPLDFHLIDRGLSTANIPNATLIHKYCTDHDQNVLDSMAIGTEEAKPTFKQVDSHNCNRALLFTTMNGHSALDCAIDFFQSFACANPIDGLHEVHRPPTSELARLERSMEDPINLDRTSATQVALPELEIYQSHKQPLTQEARFELVLYQSLSWCCINLTSNPQPKRRALMMILESLTGEMVHYLATALSMDYNQLRLN
ncbi:unnamed protein product [Cylindrotheca closterium]|uniref:Uncharacterized protein n=1 Tax=Cylindrotheca closterium TaxID=2856 RepID=A0AAD2FYF8_9STRA|nr:unnamed protein product [Cylindrotheca closterium]